MIPTDDPNYDPNPPGWLLGVIINEQQQEDRSFADKESAYKAAASNWINYCVQQHQAQGAIQPFAMSLPTKQVFYAIKSTDPNYTTQPFKSVTAFDPTLKPPVEPPNTVIVPPYHNPFSTGATTADVNSQVIISKLDQILAHLGIQ